MKPQPALPVILLSCATVRDENVIKSFLDSFVQAKHVSGAPNS